MTNKTSDRFSGTTNQCRAKSQEVSGTLAAGLGLQIEVRQLVQGEEKLTLSYLQLHPLENLILIGFIRDHGLVNERNRGSFYGYFCDGWLSGVALLGHHTLRDVTAH